MAEMGSNRRIQDILDHLDGTLSRGRAAAFEQELARDPALQREIDEIRESRAIYLRAFSDGSGPYGSSSPIGAGSSPTRHSRRDQDALVDPTALLEKIWERLPAAPDRPLRRRRPLVRRLLLAAAVLLAAMATFPLLRPESGPLARVALARVEGADAGLLMGTEGDLVLVANVREISGSHRVEVVTLPGRTTTLVLGDLRLVAEGASRLALDPLEGDATGASVHLGQGRFRLEGQGRFRLEGRGVRADALQVPLLIDGDCVVGVEPGTIRIRVNRGTAEVTVDGTVRRQMANTETLFRLGSPGSAHMLEAHMLEGAAFPAPPRSPSAPLSEAIVAVLRKSGSSPAAGLALLLKDEGAASAARLQALDLLRVLDPEGARSLAPGLLGSFGVRAEKDGVLPLDDEALTALGQSGASGATSAASVARRAGANSLLAQLVHDPLGQGDDDRLEADLPLRELESRFALAAAAAARHLQDSRSTFFLRRLLKGNSSALWVAALTALQQLPDADLVPDISRVLDRASTRPTPVRIRVAAAVAGLPHRELLPALTSFLDKESEATGRAWIVFGLRSLDSPETRDLLIQLIQTDPARKVREAALASLSALGDPRAVEGVRQALGSADPTNRAQAVAMAAMLRSPELIPDLGSILIGLRTTPVERVTAAAALGNIGNRLAVPYLIQSATTAREGLRKILGDSLARCVDVGRPRPILELLQALDTPEELVEGALRGLRTRYEISGEIPGEAQLPDLLRPLLSHASPYIRHAAAAVASALASPELETDLEARINDPSGPVRVEVNLALLRIGRVEALERVVEELDQASQEPARLALNALERMASDLEPAIARGLASALADRLQDLGPRGDELSLVALRTILALPVAAPSVPLHTALETTRHDPSRAADAVAICLILIRDGDPLGQEALRGLLTDLSVIEELARIVPVRLDDPDRGAFAAELHNIGHDLRMGTPLEADILVAAASEALRLRLVGEAPLADGRGWASTRVNLLEASPAAREREIQEIEGLLLGRRILVEALSESLLFGEDTAIRTAAAQRLGWIASYESIQALLLVRHAAPPAVLQAVDRALARLGLSAAATEEEVGRVLGADPTLLLRSYSDLLASTLDG